MRSQGTDRLYESASHSKAEKWSVRSRTQNLCMLCDNSRTCGAASSQECISGGNDT